MTPSTPWLSVIFPTRKRVPKLQRAISSYLDQAQFGEIEVLPYISADDLETRDWAALHVVNIDDLGVVRPYVGKPCVNGILGPAHTTLLRRARGQYIWMGNDDVFIFGPWLQRSFFERHTKTIFQPEIHQLNNSIYVKDGNCPFFILDRNSVPDPIRDPIDSSTLEFLRANGWKTIFVPGLHVWHDRDETNCNEIKK